MRAQRSGRTLLVGCGKIGTRLGQLLVDGGGEVLGLRRTRSAVPAAFTALAVDLSKPVQQALPVVDSMVITLPPARSAGSGPDDTYRLALHHLAAALPAVPPRVVFVSSTRVFDGQQGDRALTEADRPAPSSARARMLRAGEQLATELFDALIVRPAGIYGPGRELLLRKVLEGTAVQYSRRTNRIHETDLVRTLQAVLSAPTPPRVLHAVDQSPAPLGDVVTYIAGRLGLPPPPRIEPSVVSGTVLDGARLLRLLGALQYPTFQAGYDHLITTRDRHGEGG